MRVATFNANSIRARLDTVLTWLERHDPDVLCIQETKVCDEDFPAEAFTETGWHVVFRGQKAYNGIAFISREQPKAVTFGFDDGGPADETRLGIAKIGPLHVVNTYVPQGRELEHEMYAYKKEWFSRLRNYLDNHFSPRARLVWVGDLNVARRPEDVHAPEQKKNHVCFHEEIRQVFEQTLSWGFEDVFRRHHPEPGQYTFFDYRFKGALEQNHGWRIDYILATPSVARRSTDSFIDLEPRRGDRPSDHTFLVADFDL